MKKFTGTWIVVAVFAALLAFLLVGKPKSREEAKEDALRLSAADREALESISIENENGVFVLERKADGGEWRITAPRDLPVEDSVLNQMKNALAELLATDRVWETAGEAERAKAGLAEPAAVVRWKTAAADGDEGVSAPATGTLEIGAELPKKDTYYVASSAKPGIFTARKWSVEIFTKGLAELRRRKIVEFERDAVRTVLLEVPGREPLMLTRADALAPWMASTPFAGRADRGRVNGLITRVSNLRAVEFVDEPPAAPGLEGLRGAVHLSGDGGKTWSVLVGAETKGDGGKTLFRVREGETGQVALAEGPLPEDFRDAFDAWRDRQLFDFFADDVTELTLELGKGPLTVRRDEDGMFATTSEPKAAVNPEATGFLRAVRDASIAEFGPDAPAGSPKATALGLDAPVLRATWTANGRPFEIVIGAQKRGSSKRWARTHESPTAVLVDAAPIVSAASELGNAPAKATAAAASTPAAAATPAASPAAP